MYEAERRVLDEKRTREESEKNRENARDSQHLAALMWGIYWPEEVGK
jgi:hypothetical protein